MKPVIGITSNYSTEDFHGISTKIGAKGQEWQLIADDYIYAVEKAGGIPLILPVLSSHEDISTILSKIDGLILSGGSDIDPRYYNEYPKDGLSIIMPKRDYYELTLAKVAIEKTNMPILGICRGSQVLMVSTDGSLNQDMRYQKSQSFKHTCVESPKYHATHSVTIENDSIFKEIFDKEVIGVNSFHHQSIDKLGKGFKVSMLADDQTIEGVEMVGDRFIVGTQWHPEMMVEKDSYYLSLFETFVNKSRDGGRNG